MSSHVNHTFSTRPLLKNEVDLLEKLARVIQEVFENDGAAVPSNAHLQKLLSNRQFVAIAAFDGEEIIGGLTAYELPMATKECPEIFIYDVAVKPEHQRRGVGKQLIATLKDYCRQHGIGDIFVAAHEEDEHAVKFYRSIGGQGENTVFFTFNTSEA